MKSFDKIVQGAKIVPAEINSADIKKQCDKRNYQTEAEINAFHAGWVSHCFEIRTLIEPTNLSS